MKMSRKRNAGRERQRGRGHGLREAAGKEAGPASSAEARKSAGLPQDAPRKESVKHPEMIIDVNGRKWAVAMATFYRLVAMDDNSVAYLPTDAKHTSAAVKRGGATEATAWKLLEDSVQDYGTYEACEAAKPGLCVRRIGREAGADRTAQRAPQDGEPGPGTRMAEREKMPVGETKGRRTRRHPAGSRQSRLSSAFMEEV